MKILVIILFLFSSIYCFSQNRPFQQNEQYKYGYQPTTVTAQDALDAYEVWKPANLIYCDDGAIRVRWDNEGKETVSEGIGYGMLMAAYFGEQEIFDGLWKYYKKFMNAHGLMGWDIIGCDDPPNASRSGASSATDADIDAAWALLVAHDQFGGSKYLDDARELIGKIKTYETELCSNGKRVLKPGEWGGCDGLLLVSYFAPAYYRSYAEATNDPTWLDLAADTYYTMSQSVNPITGLVPHHQYASTAEPGPGTDYDIDAVRIAWRISLDYTEYGTPEAKEFLSKLSDFATDVGYANIKASYHLDGTPASTSNVPNWGAGSWACAHIPESQERVNEHATQFNNLGDEASYYSGALRVLYMLQLSGNYWKPEIK